MLVIPCVQNKEDERDVPLLREDQERINQFARLTHRVSELRAEIDVAEVHDPLSCISKLSHDYTGGVYHEGKYSMCATDFG